MPGYSLHIGLNHCDPTAYPGWDSTLGGCINDANSMMQLLERRLDNVLRRLGVGRTVWATRQIVAHGHVLVNGRKTDIASFLTKPGDQITFKEGIHKVLRDNMEQNAGHNVPNWLE